MSVNFGVLDIEVMECWVALDSVAQKNYFVKFSINFQRFFYLLFDSKLPFEHKKFNLKVN